MIKLTEDRLKEICANGEAFFEEKQQILNDYEKARKWDYVVDETGSKLFDGYIDGQELRERIEKKLQSFKDWKIELAKSKADEKYMDFGIEKLQELLQESKNNGGSSPAPNMKGIKGVTQSKGRWIVRNDK